MATACITLLIANLCDKYLSVYTHKVDNWNSVYWSRQADDKVRETVAKCVQSRGLWGTVLITAPLEHWFWIHRIVRRQNHDSYMNRFFHAPLVLMAWHQLVLFSKASTWPHPFIACSWGTGVGFFRGLWWHQINIRCWIDTKFEIATRNWTKYQHLMILCSKNI